MRQRPSTGRLIAGFFPAVFVKGFIAMALLSIGAVVSVIALVVWVVVLILRAYGIV